jgi:hypothetical protein
LLSIPSCDATTILWLKVQGYKMRVIILFLLHRSIPLNTHGENDIEKSY